LVTNNEKTLKFFPAKILPKFSFGDPDAKTDDLLTFCHQKIRGVEEFLSGTKNIVLGERGVGKSALFKLVADGVYKIHFDHQNKQLKQLIVAIDEELDYLALAAAIESRYVGKAYETHSKYRILWEVYILSRVVEKLGEQHEDEELKTIRSDIHQLLGVEPQKKFSLLELVNGLKLTGGVKFDQIGTYTPSISIENSKPMKAEKATLSDSQIASLRTRIRKLLKSRKTVAIVMIDKIDDFVVGLEYVEQKKSVQALLACTQDMRLPELKLKIFLRADIYRRLDFEKLGYDKLVTQTVRLEWTAEDIAGFVAKRLAHNYELLDVPRPSWVISKKWLEFDPSLKEQVSDIFRSKLENFWDIFKNICQLVFVVAKIKLFSYKKDGYAERKTNLYEETFLKIITLIFPSKMPFLDATCKKIEMPVLQYFHNNFHFGGGCPNPRLVLLYLHFVIEEASNYYSSNPDKSCSEIETNGNGEYEVIKKEHVLRGFRRLQETTRETVRQVNGNWRKYIERLFGSISQPSKGKLLTVDRLRELISWEGDDKEFVEFIAFYKHLGLLVPDNDSLKFESRTYSLPPVVSIC